MKKHKTISVLLVVLSVLMSTTALGAPKDQFFEWKNSGPAPGWNYYICSQCGYLYDPIWGDPDNGVPPLTKFEDVPDDWVCPRCGCTYEHFIFVVEEENIKIPIENIMFCIDFPE